MIRHSALRTVAFTDEDTICEMAAKAGRYIEIHNDTAYLAVGRLTWIAPLAPAGEVSA